MTQETLKEDIEEATSVLLELARDTCWNTISQNCLFTVSEINDEDILDQKPTLSKAAVSLDEAILELSSLYEDLYDVNLHVFRSKRHKTIIEIKYYPKSSLYKAFLEQVRGSEPMLHCKIARPPYLKKESDKYDINWQLKGLRYKWNMFWWRRKVERLLGE